MTAQQEKRLALISSLIDSAQLELVSTMIYVDRQAFENGKNSNLKSLARQVHELKPHFSETEIIGFGQVLVTEKVLQDAR